MLALIAASQHAFVAPTVAQPRREDQRRHAPPMAVGSNTAAAEEQKRLYFEMAPWEKMPDPMRENEVLRKVFGGRPTTLGA